MALIKVTKAGFDGTGFPMGSPSASTPNYEIVFHRLKITRKATPPDFQYISPSGVYRNIAIGDFANRLQNNSLPPAIAPLYNGAGDPAPDIVVINPAYVVVQIVGGDDPTLAFQDGVDAFRTENDRQTVYRSLTRAYSDPDGRCRVVKFQDFDPVTSSPDSYNIYLQYSETPPSATTWIVDPKIKNRGT
jgi:hypothetical protein